VAFARSRLSQLIAQRFQLIDEILPVQLDDVLG
jgi:hypothetical protein